MKKLILQILSATAGIWLAARFVSNVAFAGTIPTLFLIGLVLGLINFFIKPLIKLITLPLNLLTLGLFSLVIDMVIIWVIDIFFLELIILGIMPLVWTTLFVWGTSLIILAIFNRKKKEEK